MLRVWPVVLRFGAALYMVVLSFAWLTLIKPGMPLVKAVGGLGAAQGLGYGAFFAALFLALPHLWAWLPDERGPNIALLNKAGRWAWAGLGAAVGLLGLAMAGASIFVFDALGLPSAVLAIVTGVAAMGGGTAQLWSAWQAGMKQGEPVHLRDAAQIKRVANMARAGGGRLSVGEVAAELGIPRPQAASLMKRMSDEGWCEEMVNSSGAGFYHFSDFADPHAKRDVFEEEQVVFEQEQQVGQSRRR